MITESLETYYKQCTTLKFDHGFSITEIEEMIPFELDVIMTLRIQELERRKQEKNAI